MRLSKLCQLRTPNYHVIAEWIRTEINQGNILQKADANFMYSFNYHVVMCSVSYLWNMSVCNFEVSCYVFTV
jgi:hypothetical protein